MPLDHDDVGLGQAPRLLDGDAGNPKARSMSDHDVWHLVGLRRSCREVVPPGRRGVGQSAIGMSEKNRRCPRGRRSQQGHDVAAADNSLDHAGPHSPVDRRCGDSQLDELSTRHSAVVANCNLEDLSVNVVSGHLSSLTATYDSLPLHRCRLHLADVSLDGGGVVRRLAWAGDVADVSVDGGGVVRRLG